MWVLGIVPQPCRKLRHNAKCFFLSPSQDSLIVVAAPAVLKSPNPTSPLRLRAKSTVSPYKKSKIKFHTYKVQRRARNRVYPIWEEGNKIFTNITLESRKQICTSTLWACDGWGGLADSWSTLGISVLFSHTKYCSWSLLNRLISSNSNCTLWGSTFQCSPFLAELQIFQILLFIFQILCSSSILESHCEFGYLLLMMQPECCTSLKFRRKTSVSPLYLAAYKILGHEQNAPNPLPRCNNDGLWSSFQQNSHFHLESHQCSLWRLTSYLVFWSFCGIIIKFHFLGFL